MAEVKVGVKLSSLGMPFRKALPMVAEMGVDAVEIDARGELRPREMSQTGLRQIRKWLDDHNLKVCAVGFQTRRGYDVADDLQARIDATKDAMRFAYSLGASVVVNHVGAIPDQDAPGWQTLLEALSDLGRTSQMIGAFLAMETGSESADQMKMLIQELPDYSVTVNFDPGNLIINGFSATDAIQTLAPYVAHVHAKDAVRDLAQGRGLEVMLGRGSADFPTILAVLEEAGYRGYFTVERENAKHPVEEISNAVQYLRNV